MIARAVVADYVSRNVIEKRAWPTGEILRTNRLRLPEARDPHRPLELTRLVFSPDLRYLLSVSRTGSADSPTVWSVADGQQVRVLEASFRRRTSQPRATR